MKRIRTTGKFWTAVLTAGLVLLLALFTLFFFGKKGGSRVVFTTGFGRDEVFRIGDEACSKPEIMVYLTNIQNQYEEVYGEQIWELSFQGVTLEENIKEMVLAQTAQMKTMYLLAEEMGISLEEAQEQRVKEAAEEYFASLNDTEIELMGVSMETIEQLYREYALAGRVYQEIIRDINPEISDDEARTIMVQHILIRTGTADSDGNRIPFSEAEKQRAYDEISEIRQLAVSGEQEFADLASRYSQDSNLTYTFGKGEMDAAFEEAAFRLETDEISGIVESESGYHIIKCLSTFDREETDANKLKIVEERRKEAFSREYDAFVETLSRALNEQLWEQTQLLHNSEVTTSDFFRIFEKYVPMKQSENAI